METSIIQKTNECCAHTFNGGIILLTDNKYSNTCETIEHSKIINVYRNSPEVGGLCRLSMKEITLDGQVTTNATDLFDGMSTREDPRLFVFDNKLHVSYSKVEYNKNKIESVKMYYSPVKNPDEICIQYGGNNESKWEKNWVFFEHNLDLYFIYSVCPEFTIVRCRDLKEFKQQWRYPYRRLKTFYETYVRPETPICLLRGGTPPVLLNNLYYCFLHTHEKPGVLYRIVVLVFDTNFKLHSYTAPISFAHYKIIFPSGAVFINKEKLWVISCGVDDKDQVLFKITHEELEKKLIFL